jgi:hypothetical protein
MFALSGKILPFSLVVTALGGCIAVFRLGKVDKMTSEEAIKAQDYWRSSRNAWLGLLIIGLIIIIFSCVFGGK